MSINTKKAVSVFVGLVTGVALSGAAAVMPLVASAETYTFNTNLKLGSRGTDVMNLQKVLNMDPATQVSTTGAGAPGSETTYFGSKTKAAVMKYQSAKGISPVAGFVGPLTRASLNAGGSTTPVTPVPAGGGVAVSTPVQPTASLAVNNAARVPFTKVTLTAGTSDVAINGIKVERTGLADDAVFAGIVLLDEAGMQIGVSRTFNSLHQATVGEAMVLKAGTSRTFTVAGNMVANNATRAGQIAYLSVIGVDTTATVAGTFPITGAGHIINGTLSIGSVSSFVKGPLDPNSATTLTKEVGTTAYTFASIKFSAGSAEKVRVRSIRWNQSGSAAASDIANVKTYVDGTAYDTVMSSDGKYYTSTFGDGVVVDKGNSVEVYVKADILNGSGRTIAFDIYKNTDLYVTGETFGYGLLPTTSGSAGLFGTTNPWYDATNISVSAGTLTVSKATSVAAQNVSVSVNNQPLGGFVVEVKGEPVTVGSMAFRLANWAGTGAAASTQDVTSISLVDENGSVVAGPVDIAATSPTVSFGTSVTFPIGKKTYKLVGKLGSDFATNDTIAASTTPSTDWLNAVGQSTGNSISLTAQSSAITGNTMTVKGAVMAISLSATPASQTVVAGKSDFNFANIQLNTTASGEDIKVSSFPLVYAFDGVAGYITGCELKDGSTVLNTGSNVPSLSAVGNFTVTLDAPLTVAKGAIKSIGLYCDISGSATSSSYYKFGVQVNTAWTATGAVSGVSASLSGALNAGQQMNIGTGSFTVTKDSSSPSYGVTYAGQTGILIGKLKFAASNDAITLNRVALQLTSNATSSASDIASVYLKSGSTTVGSAVFTGTATTTAVNVSGVTIPKDGSVVLGVYADVEGIDVNTASTREGAMIAIDYDGHAQAGSTYGVGESGSTVTTTSTDTAVDGLRVFKSYPTLAKLAIPSAALVTGTGVDLYRFSIAATPATGNGIGLKKFVVNVATSTAGAAPGTTTVTNLKVYAYTDSGFSTPVSGFTNGQVVATLPGVASGDNVATTSSVVEIPAGSTYYFRVLGDVTFTGGTAPAGSITTKIQGDTAYPALATKMGTVNSIATSNLIWSPIATTTALAVTDIDWTNGYGVAGLPSDGMTGSVISK